jgi:anti-sigma-K factor RskA
MNLPENYELLQRYHDGEVSVEEAAEVEALLARDRESLDFLGHLDAMRELTQAAEARVLEGVSFDNFWGAVESRIAVGAPEPARAAAPTREEAGLGAWIRSLFAEHKSAWVTAGATAFAVALVLAAFQALSTHDDPVQKVIEKHFVYIDSVDNSDPESTVLVSSLKDDGSAVIWLLPNSDEASSDDEAGDEGVVIEEEPL